VSHVLQAESHFNLEHAEKINRTLHHSKEESHFFLLLVQLARAGTEPLRDYFREQMRAVLDRRLEVKNRLSNETKLSFEESSRYYSSWVYGAVRVATSIPALRTRDTIARRLQIEPEKLTEILDFLTACGLVDEKNGEYAISSKSMHLGNDSALIMKHHTNWRVRAIASFDREQLRDLHYSSVLSLSRKDAIAIKAILLDAVEKLDEKVAASPEETLYSFCMDFYEL
jgi:uncharacterized protein (TIGR02147 family)